ncbi:unnamed protein product [Amoebophrya sp. A120]|nr:unnamed protein product [Amoebophrya sp. A120]|eukprot:GSA120T00011400001.1
MVHLDSLFLQQSALFSVALLLLPGHHNQQVAGITFLNTEHEAHVVDTETAPGSAGAAENVYSADVDLAGNNNFLEHVTKRKIAIPMASDTFADDAPLTNNTIGADDSSASCADCCNNEEVEIGNDGDGNHGEFFDAFAFGRGGHAVFLGAAQAFRGLTNAIGGGDLAVASLVKNTCIGSSDGGSWFVQALLFDQSLHDVLRTTSAAFPAAMTGYLQAIGDRYEKLVADAVAASGGNVTVWDVTKSEPNASYLPWNVQQFVLSKAPAEIASLPVGNPDAKRNLAWRYVCRANLAAQETLSRTVVDMGRLRWAQQTALPQFAYLGAAADPDKHAPPSANFSSFTGAKVIPVYFDFTSNYSERNEGHNTGASIDNMDVSIPAWRKKTSVRMELVDAQGGKWNSKTSIGLLKRAILRAYADNGTFPHLLSYPGTQKSLAYGMFVNQTGSMRTEKTRAPFNQWEQKFFAADVLQVGEYDGDVDFSSESCCGGDRGDAGRPRFALASGETVEGTGLGAAIRMLQRKYPEDQQDPTKIRRIFAYQWSFDQLYESIGRGGLDPADAVDVNQGYGANSERLFSNLRSIDVIQIDDLDPRAIHLTVKTRRDEVRGIAEDFHYEIYAFTNANDLEPHHACSQLFDANSWNASATGGLGASCQLAMGNPAANCAGLYRQCLDVATTPLQTLIERARDGVKTTCNAAMNTVCGSLMRIPDSDKKCWIGWNFVERSDTTPPQLRCSVDLCCPDAAEQKQKHEKKAAETTQRERLNRT